MLHPILERRLKSLFRPLPGYLLSRNKKVIARRTNNLPLSYILFYPYNYKHSLIQQTQSFALVVVYSTVCGKSFLRRSHLSWGDCMCRSARCVVVRAETLHPQFRITMGITKTGSSIVYKGKASISEIMEAFGNPARP